jgi:Tfp pilus assembly protein PilF
VKVQQVAEELGVRYVLEGSVRRAGDQVRINAQLIDATTGGHLWADRYDGAVGNIFALQDKITQKIVAALAVQLTPDEREQAASKDTDNVAAYDAFLQGWELFQRYIPVDNARAVPHFERAIKFDPEFARAYAALGAAYLRGSLYAAFHRALGVPSPLSMRMGQASENLRKALAIDESEPLALQTSALWRLSYGQHDKGLADARRAVALQPNDADGHATLARLLNYSGMPKEAARSVQTAMRLNPYYRTVYLEDLGHAQLLTGRHEEAAKTLERAVERNPDLPEARVFLTAAYGYLGRAREAEVHITEVRRLRSVFTLGAVRKSSAYTNYKNPDDLERLVAGLRKAYVPEAGVVRSNQTILTGDEKSALLSGKTWIGIALETDDHYWVDVDEDGTLSFRGAYGDLTGTWREMGKGWCRDVPSFGPEECGFLVRNENGSFDEKNEYSWVKSSAEFPFSLQP